MESSLAPLPDPAHTQPGTGGESAPGVYVHNSKCAAILKLKDQVITVIAIQHKLGEPKRIADSHYRETAECTVLGSNPQSVRLQILASGRYVTEPLEHVTVGYDENRHRPMLVVRGY